MPVRGMLCYSLKPYRPASSVPIDALGLFFGSPLIGVAGIIINHEEHEEHEELQDEYGTQERNALLHPF